VPQDARRGFWAADTARIRHLQIHHAALGDAGALRRLLILRRMMVARTEAQDRNDYAPLVPAFAAYVRHERALCARLTQDVPDIDEAFDVLLDRHTPGLRFRHIKAIEDAIMPVCAEALARFRRPEPDLRFVLNDREQKALALELMDMMGLDRRRLGVVWNTGEPFARGYGDDVRVVVRTRGGDFTRMVVELVHEAGGHGLYRQARTDGWHDRCGGLIPGAAADETPPLLLEHFVARTRGFAAFVWHAMERAGVNRNKLTPAEIHARMLCHGRVASRLDSDIHSYALHSLHRIYVVRDLVNGRAEPTDLPRLWQKYERAFLLPPGKGRGTDCVQDLQMFTGYMGYLGSYLPGLMAAANSFEGLKRARPDFEEKLAQGDFSAVGSWLHRDIFRHGGKYKPDISPEAFVRHMRAQFPPPARGPALRPG
jgi:carboxypeptidase Taq